MTILKQWHDTKDEPVKIEQAKDGQVLVHYPDGRVERAKRVHLYPWTEVLHPRGSMEKESLGEEILKRLKEAYEHWTDPRYGDNPTIHELHSGLDYNLHSEVQEAYDEFFEWMSEREGRKPPWKE